MRNRVRKTGKHMRAIHPISNEQCTMEITLISKREKKTRSRKKRFGLAHILWMKSFCVNRNIIYIHCDHIVGAREAGRKLCDTNVNLCCFYFAPNNMYIPCIWYSFFALLLCIVVGVGFFYNHCVGIKSLAVIRYFFLRKCFHSRTLRQCIV